MKKILCGLLLFGSLAMRAQVSQPTISPTTTTPTSCGYGYFYALTTTSPYTIYGPNTGGTCQSLGTGSGSGTVTSVSGLTPLFTTSNATTTPTFSLLTAAQNSVFAGPSSGGVGAPSYRALVTADLPAGTGNTTSTSLTTTFLPVANGANSLINSSVSDNGSLVSTAESLSALGLATTSSATAGYVSFTQGTALGTLPANSVVIEAPSGVTTSYACTWPTTAPTSTNTLYNCPNGGGTGTWAAPSTSSISGGTANSFALFGSATTITAAAPMSYASSLISATVPINVNTGTTGSAPLTAQVADTASETAIGALDSALAVGSFVGIAAGYGTSYTAGNVVFYAWTHTGTNTGYGSLATFSNGMPIALGDTFTTTNSPLSVDNAGNSTTVAGYSCNTGIALCVGATSSTVAPFIVSTAGALTALSVSVAAARKGTFVCTSGGTITVANTNAITTSDIIITTNTPGGTQTYAPNKNGGTSGTNFTVICASLDTSTYNYDILN